MTLAESTFKLFHSSSQHASDHLNLYNIKRKSIYSHIELETVGYTLRMNAGELLNPNGIPSSCNRTLETHPSLPLTDELIKRDAYPEEYQSITAAAGDIVSASSEHPTYATCYGIIILA